MCTSIKYLKGHYIHSVTYFFQKLELLKLRTHEHNNDIIWNYRYARKEVPFYIEPSKGIGKACMDSLVQLPRILCQEEKEAFSKTTDGTDLDLITKLHNVSGSDIFYWSNWCNIIFLLNVPVLENDPF